MFPIHQSYRWSTTANTARVFQVGAVSGAVAILARRLSPFEFEAEVHIGTIHRHDCVTASDSMLQSPGPLPEEIVGRMIKGF